MATIVVHQDRRSTAAGALLPVLFFACPLIASVAPRSTPILLAILGPWLIVAALRRRADWGAMLRPSAAMIACLVFTLYLFVNALWAADQAQAFGKAASFLAAVLIAFAGSHAFEVMDDRELHHVAFAFAAGAFAGALFVLVEVATGGIITRWAMNSIDFFKPKGAKHIGIVHGKVIRLSLSDFNLHTTVLSLNLWPALLVLAYLAGLARRNLFIALFFLAVALPIALSLHESSQVALVLSPLVLLLALKWPSITIKALAALWCVGFVLVLPLDFWAYNSGLHLASWLPSSARARVIIWQYTAERVLEHPWLGIGIASTPAVRDQRKQEAPAQQPEGFVFHRSTGQHAHDLFLQCWYELGLAGVIFAAIAGALVVLRMVVLPILAQPFAAAAFATFLSISAFAWGIWQGWFMCAVALVPLYFRLASSAVDPARAAPVGGPIQKKRATRRRPNKARRS